nr:hypothetical protein [Fodinicola feengrottensis]
MGITMPRPMPTTKKKDAVLQDRVALVQTRQQKKPDAENGRTDNGKSLVVAQPADQLAGAERGDQQADDHRQHQQAGHRRTLAVDHLQEGRDIAERAEHTDTESDTHHAGQREDAVLEEFQRQHGLFDERLSNDEQRQQHYRADPKANDLARVPGVFRATPAGDQHNASTEAGKQRGAEIVELESGLAARKFEDDRSDDHRDHAERDVDVEAVAPGALPEVGQESTEQRAGHRGDTESATDQALVFTAFARRDHVADDRLRTDHQTTATNTLQRTENDQLGNVLGGSGQCRADQEDHDRQLEKPFPADQVAELAVDGQHDRGGQQIRRDHPLQVGQAMQVADDFGQCGGNDGLVEGGEQDDQHQGADDR